MQRREVKGEKKHTNQTGVSQWSTVADLRRLIVGVVPAYLVHRYSLFVPCTVLPTVNLNVKWRCYWLCLVCGLATFDMVPVTLTALCRGKGRWGVFQVWVPASRKTNGGNVLHTYLDKNNHSFFIRLRNKNVRAELRGILAASLCASSTPFIFLFRTTFYLSNKN